MSRFLQICCSRIPDDAHGHKECLYALDAEGMVWWFDFSKDHWGWRRLPDTRIREGGQDLDRLDSIVEYGLLNGNGQWLLSGGAGSALLFTTDEDAVRYANRVGATGYYAARYTKNG